MGLAVGGPGRVFLSGLLALVSGSILVPVTDFVYQVTCLVQELWAHLPGFSVEASFGKGIESS